jgi:hypothetical protein
LERRPNVEAEQAFRATIEPWFCREIIYKKDDGCIASRFDRLRRPRLRELLYRFAALGMSVRYALTGCRLIDDCLELEAGVEAQFEKFAARRGRRRK